MPLDLPEKHFDNWIQIKKRVHNKGKVRSFHEGEVWWIAVGENVGVEINGKGPDFARPVVIFRKLSRLCCLVVPLTSQDHSGSWYVRFELNKRIEYATLSQIRTIGVERLYRRIGRLSKCDFQRITDGVLALFFEKMPPIK